MQANSTFQLSSGILPPQGIFRPFPPALLLCPITSSLCRLLLQLIIFNLKCLCISLSLNCELVEGMDATKLIYLFNSVPDSIWHTVLNKHEVASKANGVLTVVYSFRIQRYTMTFFPYSLFKYKVMNILWTPIQTITTHVLSRKVKNHTSKYNLWIELICVRPYIRYSVNGYVSLSFTSNLGGDFCPSCSGVEKLKAGRIRSSWGPVYKEWIYQFSKCSDNTVKCKKREF